ncbi:cysteine desulfurase family protein [Ruminococcaceae bacterium FB2012]|nr:cysteine desulfurase family protein [Ruminococcaceae bacterium FB2012]
MINFDNSASSFPKPLSVRNAVAAAVTRYGGNPGRSGHRISMQAAEKVFEAREAAAAFFGAETENVAFTANATFALNMAIKGIMQYGGHIIISGYEHNAVSRPVYALSQSRGVRFSVADVDADDDVTVKNFESLIARDTKCICCTAASNVTGRILPYRRIAELCARRGICFIGDCSQAAGLLDIKLSDGFDFICTSGQKALYGPSGTGLLITNGRYPLSTIIEGGTGTNSAMLEQPAEMPERLESGTLNTVGIIGLREGIRFVSEKTPSAILAHEHRLCDRLISRLSRSSRIKIFRMEAKYVPIVAFNVGELNSHVVSTMLSEKGFALRGGLHCAALAHNSLGTLSQGAVRFSPSVFNTSAQVDMLADAVLSL